MKLLFDFICLELFSLILGAGLGFLQGIASFARQKTEVMLGLSGWAALMGGVVAAIIIPVMYYSMVRSEISVYAGIQMIALIGFIGIISAFLLGVFLDAGWLSWIITCLASVVVCIAYTKHHFRIF